MRLLSSDLCYVFFFFNQKSACGMRICDWSSGACPSDLKVTLPRDRMYEFLDRLITIALPRVRDFRGVSPNSFDGRGNYALGLKDIGRAPGGERVFQSG